MCPRSIIKAIAFDLDNTLIDRDAAMLRWAATWPVTASLRQQALVIDEGGQGDRVALARFLDQHVAGEIAWSPQAIASQVAKQVQPCQEVIALLKRLAERYRLAIVTNGGSRSQRNKLRRAKLRVLVNSVIISDEVGVAKPDAAIFHAALGPGELDCRATETLFVGDSMAADIVGASALGMQTCWISSEPAQEPADYTIASLLELEAAVLGIRSKMPSP